MSLVSPLIHRQAAQTQPPVDASRLEVRLTMAPHYFGSICGWLFLGLMMVQTLTYYKNYPRDSWLLKSFVYGAVSIQIMQTALETYVGYHYLVDGWGIADTIVIPPKPLFYQPILVALSGMMVQNYFTWRIWSFSRGIETGTALLRIICILISILSVASIASATAIPVILSVIDIQSRIMQEAFVVTTIWIVCSCVVDMTITICMFIILRGAKSRASFRETQDRISRPLNLTIQTGSLTSALAIIILVFFTRISIGNMYTWPAYILGKSYVISLLANLNVRGERAPSRLSGISFSPGTSKQSKHMSYNPSGVLSDRPPLPFAHSLSSVLESKPDISLPSRSHHSTLQEIGDRATPEADYISSMRGTDVIQLGKLDPTKRPHFEEPFAV